MRVRIWYRALSTNFVLKTTIGIKFERNPTVSIIRYVKWLRTIVVLTLAALWLPVSVHCQLEQLPGLEFLSCCNHEDTTAPHQDDDCKGDACAVVESGLYKTEERQISLPAPDWMPVASYCALRPEACFCAEVRSSHQGTAPPELSRVWQFSFRTALLPRAPSVVS